MSTLQERLRGLRRMYWGSDTQALDEAIDRIDADAERIKALEADAERYRWLRDVHKHHYTVTRHVGGATIPRFEGAQLDAAIDAARSKT